MIIREAPIDNPWSRAAGMWLISFLMVAALGFVILEAMELASRHMWWVVAFAIAGALALRGVAIFHHTGPWRVVEFALVVGGIGGVPLVLALCIGAMAYFIVQRSAFWITYVGVGTFVVLSAWWAVREVRCLRETVHRRRFVENEFRVGEEVVTLTRSPRTDLDTPGPAARSAWGERLIFFLPSAYLLQRLLSDTGGVSAALLLLSALAVPLAVYAIGKLVRGAYLWIYLVRRVEAAHGKPVVLASA